MRTNVFWVDVTRGYCECGRSIMIQVETSSTEIPPTLIFKQEITR